MRQALVAEVVPKGLWGGGDPGCHVVQPQEQSPLLRPGGHPRSEWLQPESPVEPRRPDVAEPPVRRAARPRIFPREPRRSEPHQQPPRRVPPAAVARAELPPSEDAARDSAHECQPFGLPVASPIGFQGPHPDEQVHPASLTVPEGRRPPTSGRRSQHGSGSRSRRGTLGGVLFQAAPCRAHPQGDLPTPRSGGERKRTGASI